MARFHIPGGQFRSGNNFAPVLCPRTVRFRARFHANCLYNPALTDGQINKLAGVSGFNNPLKIHHHHNSVRVGWSCDTAAPGHIVLWSYDYVNGVRQPEKPLGRVLPGVCVELMVTLPKKFLAGYKLFPYFGGQTAAPQAMTIDLEWINDK